MSALLCGGGERGVMGDGACDLVWCDLIVPLALFDDDVM